MTSLPQPLSQWRAPRAYPGGNIPAVLRFSNGQRTEAKLQAISLTGGLLSLSQPVLQGSQVKVMFLTGAGSVLGGAEMGDAEMLLPGTSTLQPFRFVSLAADDQRRLGTLIWERSGQNMSDQDWIQKLRAASARDDEPRPKRFKLAGAVGLLTIALAVAAYLLHTGLLN
jgi:hypothetical protein